MLENRQRYNWDAYLPGEGLLITKINYSSYNWRQNRVNYSSSNMGIDLMEADGNAPAYNQSKPQNGYFGKVKDAFPAGAESFSEVGNYKISNIVLENELISLDLNGGGKEQTLATSFVLPAVDGYQKILIGGQLYIMYKGAMYNVQGIRVN